MTRAHRAGRWSATIAGLLAGGLSACNQPAAPANHVAPVAPVPVASAPVASAPVASTSPAVSVVPVGSAAPVASARPPAPGAKRVLAVDSPGEPPAGVPAALYAALFEEKRVWKISGSNKKSWHDERPRKSQSSFQATCRVARVGRFSWGVMSEITCEDLPEVASLDPLTGFWFATPEGLHHSTERPGREGFEVSERALVIAATPVALKKEEQEPNEPSGLRRTVERKGKAWCSDEISWGGDEGWTGRCFEPTVGFSSGRWGWAGGSTNEAEFKLVR